MALTPGTRLGIFEVTAQIGEGGMGQVYRAHDAKLNRDVALKVLPDSFASDPERLARFTREAQTLAALNHPNIAHIHGSLLVILHRCREDLWRVKLRAQAPGRTTSLRTASDSSA